MTRCDRARLRPLHAIDTIPPSSIHHWLRQTTDEIVASLHPDGATPLVVKDDGTVMDGNARILVLLGRGYDVEALSRKRYEA